MKLSWSGRSLVALSLASTWLLAPDAASYLSTLHGAEFPDVLLAAGALTQLGISVWILATCGLAVAGGSTRLIRLTTPALLRQALFVGAAGVLAVAPAHAEPQHSLDGLLLPDRPTTTARVAPAHDTGSIYVRPGDTLWAIAERSLPAGASVADIATATAQWHAANRAVIGPHPDVIFPGQKLTPPVGKDQP